MDEATKQNETKPQTAGAEHYSEISLFAWNRRVDAKRPLQTPKPSSVRTN